jgi:hypothetical protein
MPKLCHARAPTDPAEAAQIRKLAQSHHAPYDCKQRAQMIALSWEGLRTGEIACHLRCHPQTVRERFERFNAEGVEGLTNRPGAGRKARLTERDRSQLIALVAQPPPGRPVRLADGQLVADHPTEPTRVVLRRLSQHGSPAGHCHCAQSGPSHPAQRRRALARGPFLGRQ